MSEVFGGYNETLTIQKAPDKEKAVSDFLSPQKIGERRLQREINTFKENQENKKENYEFLLGTNPDETHFFYEDGELLPISEYVGQTGTDFVHIKTRESIIAEVSILNESLNETRIDKEIKKLDNLIMGVHKDNPNIRLLLMEMRSQLSGYGKIDSYDFYGEELQDMLFFLEKQDSGLLSTGDYLGGAYNTFNFCRKHLAMDAKVILAGIKDVTSSRLYQYGEENEAPFEIWLEDNIVGNDYIFDSAEPYVLETGRTLASTASGAIDGSLDYIGAVVDLNIVPDEVFSSFKELLPILIKDYKEIGNQILEGIDGVAEAGYIVGYVIGLILGAKFIPSPLAWGGVVKNAATKLRALNISENIISKVRTNLISAESSIQNSFSKYMPRIEAAQKQVPKLTRGGKQSFDKGYDTVKYFNKGSKQEILASRKALDTATNSAILASIFGDKIQGQVDNMTNTDFAMSIYEEQILRENSFLISEVEYGAYHTSGELQYNLIRVKERFGEIRETFDKEIVPIGEKLRKIRNGGAGNFEAIKLIKQIKNSREYNELTRLIVKFL